MKNDFNRLEIERLFQAKDLLLRMSEEVSNNSVPGWGFQQNSEGVNQFIAVITRDKEKFEARFALYKYQLYTIIIADNWQQKLVKWVEKMSEGLESVFGQYSAIVRVHNMVAFMLPNDTPIGENIYRRMENVVLGEAGYSKGYEIIKQIYDTETDETVKTNLAVFIEKHNNFMQYKDELTGFIKGGKLDEGLLPWAMALRDNGKSYTEVDDLISEFMSYICFTSETGNNEKLQDDLCDVMEILAEQRREAGMVN